MLVDLRNYLIPIVLSRGLNFALVPYMTANMAIDAYGQLGLLLILIPFLLDLFHHSSSGYYTVKFYEITNEYKLKLFWQIISQQIIPLTLLLLIFLTFYKVLFSYGNITAIQGISIYFIILSRSFILCALVHFKTSNQSRKYASTELLEAILIATLTFILFEVHEATLTNRLISMLTGSLGAFILAIILLDLPIKSYNQNQL